MSVQKMTMEAAAATRRALAAARLAVEQGREAAEISKLAIQESERVLRTAGTFWFAKVVERACP